MRAARLGADGILRDAYGIPAQKTPKPMMGNIYRPNPAIRYLGQDSTAPSRTGPALTVTGLSVARKYGVSASEFCYVSDIGDPKKHIYPSRLVYLNDEKDDSLYVVSFRAPDKSGCVKLFKIEGSVGRGRWFEYGIKDRIQDGQTTLPALLRDFKVVPLEGAHIVWAMSLGSSGPLIPVFDGSTPESTSNQMGQTWIGTTLTSAGDVLSLISPNSDEVTLEDVIQATYMAHYTASLAVDCAAAAYDTLMIGIKAFVLYRRVGGEIARFAIKLRNIILPVLDNPEGFKKVIDEVIKYRDEFVERAALHGAYVARAGMYTVWSFLLNNGGARSSASDTLIGVNRRMVEALSDSKNRQEVVSRGIATEAEVDYMLNTAKAAVAYADGNYVEYRGALNDVLTRADVDSREISGMSMMAPLLLEDNRKMIIDIRGGLKDIGSSEPRRAETCLSDVNILAQFSADLMASAAGPATEARRLVATGVKRSAMIPKKTYNDWSVREREGRSARFEQDVLSKIITPIQRYIESQQSQGLKWVDEDFLSKYRGKTVKEVLRDLKKEQKKYHGKNTPEAKRMRELLDLFHFGKRGPHPAVVEAFMDVSERISQLKNATLPLSERLFELVMILQDSGLVHGKKVIPKTELEVIARVIANIGELSSKYSFLSNAVPSWTWSLFFENQAGSYSAVEKMVLNVANVDWQKAKKELGGKPSAPGRYSEPTEVPDDQISVGNRTPPANATDAEKAAARAAEEEYWRKKYPESTLRDPNAIREAHNDRVKWGLLIEKVSEGRRTRPGNIKQELERLVAEEVGGAYTPSSRIPPSGGPIPPDVDDPSVTKKMGEFAPWPLDFSEASQPPEIETLIRTVTGNMQIRGAMNAAPVVPVAEGKDVAPSVDVIVKKYRKLPGGKSGEEKIDPNSPATMEGGRFIDHFIATVTSAETVEGSVLGSPEGKQLLLDLNKLATSVKDKLKSIEDAFTSKDGKTKFNPKEILDEIMKDSAKRAQVRAAIEEQKALEKEGGLYDQLIKKISEVSNYAHTSFTMGTFNKFLKRLKGLFMWFFNFGATSYEIQALAALNGCLGPIGAAIVGWYAWGLLWIKGIAIISLLSLLPGVGVVRDIFARLLGYVRGVLPEGGDTANNQTSPGLGDSTGIWPFLLMAGGIGMIFYGKNFFDALGDIVGGFFKFGTALAPASLKKRGIARGASAGGKRRGARIIVEDWLDRREAALHRLKKAQDDGDKRAEQSAQHDLDRAIDKLKKAQEEGENVPPNLWGFNWLG